MLVALGAQVDREVMAGVLSARIDCEVVMAVVPCAPVDCEVVVVVMAMELYAHVECEVVVDCAGVEHVVMAVVDHTHVQGSTLGLEAPSLHQCQYDEHQPLEETRGHLGLGQSQEPAASGLPTACVVRCPLRISVKDFSSMYGTRLVTYDRGEASTLSGSMSQVCFILTLCSKDIAFGFIGTCYWTGVL
jgi:hypothetical protein